MTTYTILFRAALETQEEGTEGFVPIATVSASSEKAAVRAAAAKNQADGTLRSGSGTKLDTARRHGYLSADDEGGFLVSQASQILALLQDGPKTTRELLAEVPSIVHSRVAGLRDQGHNIVCERIDGEGADAFRYTLLPEPAAGVRGAAITGSAGSGSGVGYSAETSNADDLPGEGPGRPCMGALDDRLVRRSKLAYECVMCGQQMLHLALRCDDCKPVLDGSEATHIGHTSGGGHGDELHDAAASLPSSTGEQLRLVA